MLFRVQQEGDSGQGGISLSWGWRGDNWKTLGEAQGSGAEPQVEPGLSTDFSSTEPPALSFAGVSLQS